MKLFFLLALSYTNFAFANGFISHETACGFGKLNADYAKAYAESYANAQCNGLPAKRISDWKLTNYTESQTNTLCTNAEASFACAQ